MITQPKLPPKAGYVEVEIDGVHTYRNVLTGELIDNEPPVEDPTDGTYDKFIAGLMEGYQNG